jgi:hypothetical protein
MTANLVKMWRILGIEIADRFSILSLHYIQDDFPYLYAGRFLIGLIAD